MTDQDKRQVMNGFVTACMMSMPILIFQAILFQTYGGIVGPLLLAVAGMIIGLLLGYASKRSRVYPFYPARGFISGLWLLMVAEFLALGLIGVLGFILAFSVRTGFQIIAPKSTS